MNDIERQEKKDDFIKVMLFHSVDSIKVAKNKIDSCMYHLKHLANLLDIEIEEFGSKEVDDDFE